MLEDKLKETKSHNNCTKFGGVITVISCASIYVNAKKCSTCICFTCIALETVLWDICISHS